MTKQMPKEPIRRVSIGVTFHLLLGFRALHRDSPLTILDLEAREDGFQKERNAHVLFGMIT
jgi:hypothetical protein